MNETAIGNKTNIGTTDEFTRNQRTYVTIQENKHRLKDLRTDSRFKTNRNGDEEVSERSNIPAVTENHRDCDVTKSVKWSKKQYKAQSTKRIKHYFWYNTPHSSALKTFYPLISKFTLPLDCVEVDLREKILVQLTVV